MQAGILRLARLFVTKSSLPDTYRVRGRLAVTTTLEKETDMLRWALVFLIVALIAGVFGFWGLEGLAMWIAKVLFVVFLVLFVVSLLLGRRGPPLN
jgi:uncharacterized membrane protein YtjA (UPF0391 family)